jgi:uncharacterized membrane protein YkoI
VSPLLIGVGMLFWSLEPWADEAFQMDHERARHLMQSGEILPLARIVEGEGRLRGGHLLAVELHHVSGVPVYVIDVLDSRGRVKEWRFDAKSGRLLHDLEKKKQEN